jgi:hypothetical protein
MEAQWITFLLVIVPIWFLQNVIHELSHGLTIKLGCGWNFKIWPFPSNKLGRFTFAHTIWEKTASSKDPTDSGWALIYIMPRLTNIMFMMLSVILLYVCSNTILSMILLVFMWTNFVDFCVGLFSSLKKPSKSDIWRFRDCLGIPINYLKYSCIGFIIYQSISVITTTLIKLL